ncbi:MAG: tetratricopeptide repeat protein [Burkholderiaceae bacterium]|nr:tetratricopeptide repeat protein [Burkholderiaceae bacterium]
MDPRLDEAFRCFEGGELPAAEILLSAVLADYPDDFDALHLLGVVKGTGGDRSAAIRVLARAVDVNPQHPYAQANLAKTLVDDGQQLEALPHYQAAVNLAPQFRDAWINLGTVLHGLHRPADALAAFDRALALDGQDALLWSSRGVALQGLGQGDEALEAHRKAVQIDPGCAIAWYNLGLSLAARQRFEEALAAYDRSVQIDPGLVPAWCDRGLALHAFGRYREALASYDKALELNPNFGPAVLNRTTTLLSLERPQDALTALGSSIATSNVPASGARESSDIEALRRAVQVAPERAEAWHALGLALNGAGCFAEAIETFEHLLKLAPDHAGPWFYRARTACAIAWYNLGLTLAAERRLAEALRAYDQALEQDPRCVPAWCDRGVLLHENGQHSEALAAYDQALAIDAQYARAWSNRGAVLRDLQRPQEALECLRVALRAEPTGIREAQLASDARWNQALAQLSLGQLAQGFANYEARWAATFASARRHVDRPSWLGREPVEGMRILLWSEQGFGDAIQFSRYATLLAQQGAQVWAEVRPALKELIETVPGVAGAIAEDEAPPPFDRQCPLMSLPLAFGTTLETIPGMVPYVRAQPQQVAAWRQRLQRARREPTVGIVCSGSGGHKRDASRSIGLRQLERLFGMAGCVLLQPQVREQDEAVLAEGGLLDVRSELTDFAQTAALIETLQLVITVDTAVAHLAGAMGKTVWILLSFGPDWRWMLERTDSPWYPSARLFRQSRPNDWEGVIDRVASELMRFRAC